jgi:cytochrome b561
MAQTATSAPPGYPASTKVLHWLTVVVIATQFVVGYRLVLDDDPADAVRDARADRLEARADAAATEAREEALEQRADAVKDGGDVDVRGTVESVLSASDPLLSLHVGLGLTVLVLAIVRLVRRRVLELPPWAETLSEAERRLAHRTEQTLYLAMVLMPFSGIGLLFVYDDLLPLHVAAHVLFFVALALHLSLVLKHQLVNRDRLLNRML